MAEEIKTVEVVDPKTETKVEEVQTVEELKEAGWGESEIALAEKHGKIKKEGEGGTKKVEEKTEEEKAAEAKAKEDGINKEEIKPKTSLPDFDLNPEQEKVFSDAFGAGTPVRGIYFRMKNERQSRQRAEKALETLNNKLVEANEKLTKLESNIKPEVDDDGNEIDPSEKPLTINQLEEREKKKAELIEKEQKENAERNVIVVEAQRNQEEYARTIYSDFDNVAGVLATEVLNNLDEMVPEKFKQTKVVKLIKDLQLAAASADKLEVDEYNAAQIAYEIGQYHPKYGKVNGVKPDTTGGSSDPKANGGLTTEQMKRAAKNTERTGSSASKSGGSGRRSVSIEDITAEDFNRMDYKERKAFKENHREKYLELVRG